MTNRLRATNIPYIRSSAPKTHIHKPATWTVDTRSLRAEPRRNSFLMRNFSKDREQEHSENVIPCDSSRFNNQGCVIANPRDVYLIQETSCPSPYMFSHHEKEEVTKMNKERYPEKRNNRMMVRQLGDSRISIADPTPIQHSQMI